MKKTRLIAFFTIKLVMLNLIIALLVWFMYDLAYERITRQLGEMKAPLAMFLGVLALGIIGLIYIEIKWIFTLLGTHMGVSEKMLDNVNDSNDSLVKGAIDKIKKKKDGE